MRKKKLRFLKGVSGSVVKSENDHFGMSDGIFFFLEKKVDHNVFRRENYRRLPWCCNYSNVISGSQTKVEKTEFFIVFSTFDRDPNIIMKWFRRHGNSRWILPQKTIRVGEILRKKNFYPRKGPQVRSQNRETTILGCRTDFFFCGKKSRP